MGAAAGMGGTTIKFVPVTGTDVVMKNGSQQSVQTKLQCITGMKEYENKSLEVRRFVSFMKIAITSLWK
jgi:nuclear pore complex protein Nup98-Nup96